MKNIPKKIYLQVGEDVEESDVFSDLSDITWCSDNISSTDIAYVLEEAQQPQQIETYQELEKAVREERRSQIAYESMTSGTNEEWVKSENDLLEAKINVDRILKQLEAEAVEPTSEQIVNAIFG